MMSWVNDLKGERLLVVLGMHRSGTSALSRGLLTMGVNLGSNLNPPNETNPSGHWEDLNILEFNENLLVTLSMRWDTLAPMSVERVQFIQKAELIEQAKGMLGSKISGSDGKLFGFKEPRTTKLLPFWLKVFQGEPYEVSYLLPYRNPLSVAQSLSKRDGFELTKSYLLWLLHVVPCLAETIGSHRMLVNYDDLLEDPVRIVSSIAKEFELPIDEALLHEYVTDFLDKELRHTRHTVEDLRADLACPELVRKVYWFLEEVRLGKEQLDSQASEIKIQEFVLELQNIAPILELLDLKYHQTIDLEATVANRSGEISRMHTLVESRSQHQDSVDLKLVAAEKQVQLLQHDLVASEEQGRYVKHALVNAGAKIIDLQSNLAQETHSLQITQSELIVVTQKVDLLSLRCAQAEQEQVLNIRQLELANDTVAAHNQVISQIIQANQLLQSELISVVRLMRSKGWAQKFVASFKRLLSRRASGGVKDIDLSNLPPDFDPVTYLKLNPDVALAGFDPRRHYILHGKSEARRYKDSDC
jgi:hypothetical protein